MIEVVQLRVAATVPQYQRMIGEGLTPEQRKAWNEERAACEKRLDELLTQGYAIVSQYTYTAAGGTFAEFVLHRAEPVNPDPAPVRAYVIEARVRRDWLEMHPKMFGASDRADWHHIDADGQSTPLGMAYLDVSDALIDMPRMDDWHEVRVREIHTNEIIAHRPGAVSEPDEE